MLMRAAGALSLSNPYQCFNSPSELRVAAQLMPSGRSAFQSSNPSGRGLVISISKAR